MAKYTFYIIYNVMYQLICFFFFLYANTYLNEAFVPKNLMWKNNKPRTDLAGVGGEAAIKTLTLFVEAAVLILLIYLINKVVLSSKKEIDRGNVIVRRTAKINMVVSLCFIVVLIWGSFRGFIW